MGIGGMPAWHRNASGGALPQRGGSLLAFDPPCDLGSDRDSTEGVAATGRAFGIFVRGTKWGLGSSACRSEAARRFSQSALETTFRGTTMARHMVKRMQQHLTEEGEIVVPYPHHRKLQKSCLATSISLAAAIYLELFDCASLSFLVLLASIVYWHNPRRGLRRNVDMTLAFGGLFYQMLVQAPKLVSTQHTPLLLYLVGMAAGSFCYMAARYHSKKEDFARGSAWHASLHFWANVGNLFLYWGLSRLEDPSASGREAVGI